MLNQLNNKNVGIVVGATQESDMRLIREKSPLMSWLIPGIGKQGGNLESSINIGNQSGACGIINVSRDIQAKSLFLTRPTIGHYFTNRKELQTGADEIFEKIKFGKIKIKIFKEYKLSEVKKAHEDLESRKITGPAVLIP